jgi:hypothetical protein
MAYRIAFVSPSPPSPFGSLFFPPLLVLHPSISIAKSNSEFVSSPPFSSGMLNFFYNLFIYTKKIQIHIYGEEVWPILATPELFGQKGLELKEQFKMIEGSQWK